MTGSLKIPCKDNIKLQLDVYKECLEYNDPFFDKGYCGDLLYNNLNGEVNHTSSDTRGGGKKITK